MKKVLLLYLLLNATVLSAQRINSSVHVHALAPLALELQKVEVKGRADAIFAPALQQLFQNIVKSLQQELDLHLVEQASAAAHLKLHYSYSTRNSLPESSFSYHLVLPNGRELQQMHFVYLHPPEQPTDLLAGLPQKLLLQLQPLIVTHLRQLFPPPHVPEHILAAAKVQLTVNAVNFPEPEVADIVAMAAIAAYNALPSANKQVYIVPNYAAVAPYTAPHATNLPAAQLALYFQHPGQLQLRLNGAGTYLPRRVEVEAATGTIDQSRILLLQLQWALQNMLTALKVD